MKKSLAALFLSSLFSMPVLAQTPQALFYLTRDPSSVASFLAHANQVDLLVPGWYNVDSDGLISGGADPTVMTAARAHHVPVMPIVANKAFDQADFHKLLISDHAQAEMVPQTQRLHRRAIRLRKR